MNRPDSADWREEFATWARGRLWWTRVPLVALAAWQLLQWFDDPDRWTIFSGLNLGIHEAGHLLTQPFGTFICALAGSAFQCAAPLAAALVFLRQRDFFAITLCLTWLASNLFKVAWYLADASTMAIPLVSVGGGEVYHDWNTLLDMMGLLGSEGFLSDCLRLVAYACAMGGVVGGAWILRQMALINRPSDTIPR
jgi:hypothetical protein